MSEKAPSKTNVLLGVLQMAQGCGCLVLAIPFALFVLFFAWELIR